MKLFFFFIFASTALFGVEKFSLADFDFEYFKVVRKTKAHTVYFGQNVYLKVWQEGSFHFQYGLNTLFLEAAERGFFESIAPLKGVLIDQDRCVGYVTEACRHLSQTFRILKSSDVEKIQNEEERRLVSELFERFKENIEATDFCLYGDTRGSWNMGILDGKCLFIDLDRIARFSELKRRIPNWKII